VLVHGFTQTGASWRPVTAALRRALPGLELLTPDLPGHGASPPLPAEGGDALRDAAARLGEAGGTASYLGYSMGARVCLRLALDSPRLVERLVLVGATAGIADPDERRARREADEALAARLERLGLEAFLDEWLAGPLFSHLSRGQADRAARRANSVAGLAWALRHLGSGATEPMWDELPALAAPLLVLAGEGDERYAALAGELAAAAGPPAEVRLVPGAGHAAPFEQPDAFAGLLAGWWPAQRPESG